MKKRIVMCIIASAMICGTFASCGNETSRSSSSAVTTTAETTEAGTTTAEATEAETTTEAVTTTETAATTESSSEDAAEEHLTDATAVLNNLNTIDRIVGGTEVETDTADTKQEGADSFEKVTDSRFTTVDDVKKYVTDSICGTLLERYNSLYEGDNPYFREFDGKLYFHPVPMGCGFSFTGEPVITDVTEDSFTVSMAFDNFGGTSDLRVKAVKEDGKWKASSFTVDGGAENSR